MTQPDPEYRDRQQEQLDRYLDWKNTQPDAVDRELPTRLDTIFQKHQIQRMDWLKGRATGRILEVGCNFGAVLAWCGGGTGLDLNPQNLQLAKLLAPESTFVEGDARLLDQYFDYDSFDTVMLPEVLEHLSWPNDVHLALQEAVLLASKRVLITMPDGGEDAHSHEAESFKHQFLADDEHVEELLSWFPGLKKDVRRWYGFVLIRIDMGV